MAPRLEWEITDDGGDTVVTLRGSVDEDSDFNPILHSIKTKPRLRMNLSRIDRINSCGIREWVNFMRSIPDSSNIAFVACSPVIVSQLNVISNFAGAAVVQSVQAPYVCEECGHEENILLEVHAGRPPALSEVVCPKCSSPMEFDDLVESYFIFLS